MAFIGDQQDPNAEPMKDFSPLTPGTYKAIITESDVAPLKSGNGNGLSLTFEIIEHPQHAGRRVWKTINHQHTGEVPRRIAQSELKSLTLAVGLARVDDSVEMHGRPLLIRLVIKPAGTDRKGYTRDKATNEITAFLPVGAGQPPTPPTDRPKQPETAEASHAAGKPVPIWLQGKKK